MESLDTATWLLVILGAFLVGLSKGGVLGVNNITVAMFAIIFPPKLSIGIILLLLIVGDWGAFFFYRRHAVWKYLLPIIPWTVAGVLIGWRLLDSLDGEQVGRLIGICLLVLTAFHCVRKYAFGGEENFTRIPHSWWFIGIVGLASGFASTVANSAAPIMILFFLAVALPKMEFMGTVTWFFLFLNIFKLPFFWSSNLVTREVLILDLKLLPVVLLGVVLGRYLVHRVPQKGFELFALVITALASLRLIF